jgi:hypothetical protein
MYIHVLNVDILLKECLCVVYVLCYVLCVVLCCVVLCCVVLCCVVLCCVVCVRKKKVVRGKKNSMVWYSFPVDFAVANAH